MRYERLGVTELTAGPASGTHTRFFTHPGMTNLTTGAGTDSAAVAGSRWTAKIFIPHSCTLTGIGYLIGSVGGTDKVIVELHDAAGKLVAASARAGVTVGTAATMQEVPFTQTYGVNGPAYFYITVIMNGTTGKLRTMAVATPAAYIQNTAYATGTFGTDADYTPPTTFTADYGPVAYTY